MGWKNMEEVKIKPPFIKLGQLLKYLDLIETGGDEKNFLENVDVYVNDEIDRRRGRKIYPGDTVIINRKHYKIIERW